MKVAVVIPTHNRKNYLFECLKSIYKSDYKNIDVIVVDDGSTDGTSKEVVAKFPSVRIIPGNGELWWSRAMNLGIKSALDGGADFVLALNDDVTIESHSISELVGCALQNNNALVGSLIYSREEPSMIWCAGGEMHWPWPGEFMIGGELDNGQFERVRVVKWTPGMGTLMQKEILLKLNFYDAHHLPQYMADADFALRAGNAGYKVIVTSKSKLYNNVKDTGGIDIDQKKIEMKQLVSIFTNLSSPEYLSARLTFIFRHCPKHLLIPALSIRYFRIMVYGLKRLMQ